MNETYFETLAGYVRALLDRLPIEREVQPLEYAVTRLSGALEEIRERETEKLRGLWSYSRKQEEEPPFYTGLNTIGLLTDRFTILLIKEWCLRNKHNDYQKADILNQTQTGDIIKALAYCHPGNASVNTKITGLSSNVSAKDWEEALYKLLAVNLVLWESQEVLYKGYFRFACGRTQGLHPMVCPGQHGKEHPDRMGGSPFLGKSTQYLKKKSIAIIGAGVSGLSAARILRSKGYAPVVYEKNREPGGLIRCTVEEGNLFHRVGGIVFNTKNERVKAWFGEQFDIENEFISARRNAQIWTRGEYIGYPVENYLHQLPGDMRRKIMKELLLLPWQSNHVDNFDAFLRKRFGQTLYDYYFLPYNSKLWNYDLKKIPLPWLEGKLPMPDLSQIFLNNIFRRPDKEMVHSTFYYPKQGGSSFIAHRLAEGTAIVYNSPVDLITRTENQWKVNGERYDHLIYTGDVRRLAKSLYDIPAEVRESAESVSDLPSNGTSNVLCFTDDSNLSWLYLPGKYTGAIVSYTLAISVRPITAVPGKPVWWSVSGKREESEMREELKKLPGHLEPITFNYEPDSYVIQMHDTRARKFPDRECNCRR
jgi:protoporphyrinogen oxidase